MTSSRSSFHTSTSIRLLGGDPVVLKRRVPAGAVEPGASDPVPPGPDERRRTEDEARWLYAAHHPGVVRLRRLSIDHAVLITDFAATATLQTCRHQPAAMAAVLAAVAATLGDLRARGLVHGNLDPTHVLLTGPGAISPVLCSPGPPTGGDDGNGNGRDLDDIDSLGSMADAVGRRSNGAFRHWSPVIDRLRDGARRPGPAEAAALFEALARRESRRSVFRRSALPAPRRPGQPAQLRRQG